MVRKCVAVLLLVCVGSVVVAQDKAKDKATKDKGIKEKGTQAEVVKVDAKGMMLTLKVDGKDVEYKATKETKFVGPRGGKATIKDKRLAKGAKVRIVADGKTLKEVHLPTASRKPTDKDKPKKDKPAKDK
jgi:hypothetical protein